MFVYGYHMCFGLICLQTEFHMCSLVGLKFDGLMQLIRFPEGVPWVRYHGTYKDLHLNIIWPGKDTSLG